MTSNRNTVEHHGNGLSLIQKSADKAETLDDLANLIDDIAVMNGYLLAMLRAATQRVLYQDESAVLAAVDERLADDVSRSGRAEHGLNALLAAHELLSGTGRPLFVAAEQVRNSAADGRTPPRVTS